jgi:hypothetical protein
MSKFHLGDRVRIAQREHRAHGEVGTIKATRVDEPLYPYLVEFDHYIEHIGHEDVFNESQLRPADIFPLEHTLETDSLYNYWCSCGKWRYAHVGFGEPDDVAIFKHTPHATGKPTVYDVGDEGVQLETPAELYVPYLDHN